MPRAVVQTLIAELLRRAGHFDDALEACETAQREVVELESEDDGMASTLSVIEFIRNLAIAGDDEAHSCAEAFADNE